MKPEPFAPWQCPLCGEPLTGDTALKCGRNHSFDRAKEGYWHLLPVQSMRTKAPGDSKEMVAARRAFLNAGYYGIFGRALGELCLAYGVPTGADAPLHLLDAGCGEGWYDRCIAQAFAQAGRSVQLAGFDIAKPAVRLAAKALPAAKYAVASSFAQPVRTGWADLLLNCFSPFAQEEFRRVLRPGGISVEQLRRVLGRVDVDRAVLEKPAENAKVASPGMKYKHYAPKADVYMVDASAEDYAAFLHTHSEAAALCFNEDVPYLKNRCVPYGSAADSLSQAHGLFTSLHHLDEIGAKTVYARMPRKSGVGLAVYNRLIRACAFRIVTPNEQLVIGLTGQTGAGKSTVAKQLKARGCVIIDCDAVTHDPSLYAGTCLTELQNAFGRAIIKEDGTLDRRRLANLAFASEEGKAKLNAITHPVILARLKKEIAAYKDAKVIVLDAPTLFEAGADRLCRRVVSVLADETVRLGRICRRDGLTEQEALTRMHAQQSDDFYIDRSDYTLDNTVAVSADDMDNMLAVLGCAHPGESD